MSFPVTAIQVSKESALGNLDGVQDAICRALVVGVLFAVVGTGCMLAYTDRALSSVLKGRQRGFIWANQPLFVASHQRTLTNGSPLI